jgi:multiple sugar transport system permease protein
VGAGAVFIMKQFFESIPREVEEAALIDGATPLQTLFRIVLPMATPALGALSHPHLPRRTWNEFFWPFIVLTSPREIYTLPLGLLSFRNAYGQVGDWGLILAGGFLSMIPILILFAVFQRYFVEGVSVGALKE